MKLTCCQSGKVYSYIAALTLDLLYETLDTN
jgi:hypothetical protein